MMSLQRSSLASTLYNAIKDRVTVRFADSVVRLIEKPKSVQAQFRSGDVADRP